MLVHVKMRGAVLSFDDGLAGLAGHNGPSYYDKVGACVDCDRLCCDDGLARIFFRDPNSYLTLLCRGACDVNRVTCYRNQSFFSAYCTTE